MLFDSRVSGFAIRVTANGARSFIFNYRTKSGRQRRFTIGTFGAWKTAAARKEAGELRKLVDRGGDPLGDVQTSRSAPTVSELCDQFTTEYLPKKRASTQHTYKLHIKNVIRPALGGLKVNELTFSEVDSLHRKITGRGKRYRANRVVATLSSMLSQAIKWGWRTGNPCEGIERNQEHKREPELSVDQLTKLGQALAELKDQQSAAIIGLVLLTGSRRGEVLAARWEDFRDDFRTWARPSLATKQKKPSRIPLNAPARELVLALRKVVPESSEWLFPANGGHRKDVKDSWARIRDTAGLQGLRLHDLRHVFASVLVSDGYSLPVIGRLLGHTQPATTARYAHLFDDPLRKASERAGQLIGVSGADKLASPK